MTGDERQKLPASDGGKFIHSGCILNGEVNRSGRFVRPAPDVALK